MEQEIQCDKAKMEDLDFIPAKLRVDSIGVEASQCHAKPQTRIELWSRSCSHQY